MPARRNELLEGRPLLDIASYARRGPHERGSLSPAEIEHIRRTVHRVPEVMVKVLNKGGQDLGSVRRHLSYLTRKGDLDLETDDGVQRGGAEAASALLDDWDLDLDDDRRSGELFAAEGRQPAKLVHKLLFSMPPGTPPKKVLAAVQDFARVEFALKHRYAMVLHTDEPHPHVHLVLKAVSEQGERLHIRKATLRGWRQEFARHLRWHGVAANATERAVRGEVRAPKLDGIYRAAERAASSQEMYRRRVWSREVQTGLAEPEPGRATLLHTRAQVTAGWAAVSERLAAAGDVQTGSQVDRLLKQMSPVKTDREIQMERALGTLQLREHPQVESR